MNSTLSLFSTLRLAAVGSRSDQLRIGLTAVGATAVTVMLLLAASVMFIAEGDGPYRFDVLNQPGLRPGVIISLLMLGIPMLLFVGQCSRVGAPARDRRLAMIRMAGATPSEAIRIAATETGVASMLGSALGMAVFLTGRQLFSTEHVATIATETRMDDGGILLGSSTEIVRLIPTDASIPTWALLVVAGLIPVLTTGASIVALRNVAISPFGVTRIKPTTPPRVLPAVLFAVGTIGLATWTTVSKVVGLDGDADVVVSGVLGFGLGLVCLVGLIIGAASISSMVGKCMAPRVRNPALLIAARRLISAPYTSSRATTTVLAVSFIGAAVQGVRANFLLGTDSADTFYRDTFDLLNVVLFVAVAITSAGLLVTASEAIVERRRTLATLAASGTPRSTLAKSLLAESLVPLVPSIILASVAGLLAARGLTGTQMSTWDASTETERVVGVPIPWREILTMGSATILACTALTALSLLFLRSSTDITELRASA